MTGTSEAAPPPAVRPVRRHLTDPRLLALLVALTVFRFEVVTGEADPLKGDQSWRLGLSWLRTHGFDAGTDVLFTYGPLGPIVEPTWASSRLVIGLALVASAAVALWFGWALAQGLRVHDRPVLKVVLGVGVGLLAGSWMLLPELAALAVAIDVYRRLPTNTTRAPRLALTAGYGAFVGAMALAKLSTAVIATVAVVVLALAWPDGSTRWRRLGVTGAAAIGSGLVLWVITGNGVAGLPAWVRGSTDLVTGYSSAMAATAYQGRWVTVQLVAVAGLVAMLVATQVVRGSRNGWRAQWPEAALLAVVAWSTFKAGVVRFDLHVNFTLVSLATLAVLAGTSLRWRLLPTAALLVAAWAMVADTTTGNPADVASLARARSRQPGQVWTGVQAVAQESEYNQQVDDARVSLREYYGSIGLDPSMMAALDGQRTYADSYDIAALWAYDTAWATLPVLQGYAAYTPWLDERNADALRDEDGPDAVLRSVLPVDQRRREWDTPETQLAMACSFEVVEAAGIWSVLHRAPDLCGEPREIGHVVAEPGEDIHVPTAGPDEVVVATFDVDPSPRRRLLDLLARDPDVPTVVIDGEDHRFLPTTASGRHLVALPDVVGDRDLPDEEIDIDTLRFENVGPVEATFYAVPLR